MKHLLLLCLLPFAAHGMRKVAPKAHKPPAPAHPASFSQLSTDLMTALKDIDLAKTRTILDKIGQLGKKFNDLQCLELEATTYLQALLYHQQEKSKFTAGLIAQIELEQHKAVADDAPQPKVVTPSLSHLAVLKHSKALAIQELVSNFFRAHYHEEVSCTFTSDPTGKLP